MKLLNKLGIWWITIRPKTLIAALMPLSFSHSLSYLYSSKLGLEFSWVNFSLISLCVLIIQILVNLFNDYFDHKNGADDKKETKRGLQSGQLNISEFKFALWSLTLLGFIVVIYLSINTSWLILPIGVVSLLLCYLYTGGPYPLAYHALGDIFVLFFFGPIATVGISLVHIPISLILPILPPLLAMGFISGFWGVCLLMINNIRDYENDKNIHKNTLVVVLGADWGKRLYLLSLGMSYTLYIYFSIYFDPHTLPIALLTIFFTPFLVKNIYKEDSQRNYNQLLGKTASLMFFFTVLFTISYL